MYYANGDIYEGEWLKDKSHGQGTLRCGKTMYCILHNNLTFCTIISHLFILFQIWTTCLSKANENWYEGTWRDGKKNGYGKFFYFDQGQVYEGVWLDGIAKCGTLSDCGRNEAPRPPKYPIPEVI